MEKPTSLRALGVATFVAVAAASTHGLAADILIGVGSDAQVHFDVGRAICRQVQRTNQDLTCEGFSIEGGDAAEPIAVLSNVRTGAIEMGLVQSDWHHHAVESSGPLAFMDVKFDNLRSLFALHSEPFTLVARRDSGIKGLDDLAGKRVNIGNPGSGHRAIMETVMKAKGWTRKTFQLADELTESEQSLALCHDRVQAMILTVAHPRATLAKTMELCDARIVEVTGAEIDKLVADSPFLAATEIAGGTYEGQENSVKTFGVTVTVVSSSDIEEDLIYRVTGSLFDNLDSFKRLHPALGALVPERMIKDGLSAPVHPGALRYFRERGMM